MPGPWACAQTPPARPKATKLVIAKKISFFMMVSFSNQKVIHLPTGDFFGPGGKFHYL
jgi:hypothetical protein